VHDTGYSAPDEPRPSAPTRLSERALAPDLARGVMLLLIALANAPAYLFDHPAGSRGYPDPVSQLVTLLQMLLVDTRAYPLFACCSATAWYSWPAGEVIRTRHGGWCGAGAGGWR
jgi:hypothetical protein